MKKKVISLILVLSLFSSIAASFIVSTAAAGEASFKVENTKGKRNETVTVSVTAENIVEGKNFDFNLAFDDKFLEYIPDSFKLGSEMPHTGASTAELITNDETGSYIRIVIEAGRRDIWDAVKCTVATIDFKIRENAEKSTEISLNTLSLKSSSGDLIPCIERKGTVAISVPVEELKIAEKDLSIPLNRTATVICEPLPKGASNDLDFMLTWESDNTAVATVNEQGAVTAVSFGTAVITVTSQNGIKNTCNITVVSESDSLFPVESVSLKGGDNTVVEKIKLNIPGPYPVKWTAYSNDGFIYVSLSKKTEIAYEMNDANGMRDLTILCDPTKFPGGDYTGTITVVCGGITENLLVEYTKTTPASGWSYSEHDPFAESKYRVNLALESIPTASSTANGSSEKGNPLYAIDNVIVWPRWLSTAGTWNPLTHHWLTLDLKETKKFDKIIMYFVHAEAWSTDKEFKIYASNTTNFEPTKHNPGDWVEIKHVKNNNQPIVTIDLDEQAYRYIRYYSIMPVQSEGYENLARITQFKVLGKVPYPDVEPTPVDAQEFLRLSINASNGVMAKAFCAENAFKNAIDTRINVTAFNLFSQEYSAMSGKIENWLGYPCDFMYYDVSAEDMKDGGLTELINDEKIELQISLPGGFNAESTKFVKINKNGDFEVLDMEILETEEEIDKIIEDVTYCAVSTDYFGEYIIVEDLYGSPNTSDNINQGVILTVILLSALAAGLVYRGRKIRI